MFKEVDPRMRRRIRKKWRLAILCVIFANKCGEAIRSMCSLTPSEKEHVKKVFDVYGGGIRNAKDSLELFAQLGVHTSEDEVQELLDVVGHREGAMLQFHQLVRMQQHFKKKHAAQNQHSDVEEVFQALCDEGTGLLSESKLREAASQFSLSIDIDGFRRHQQRQRQRAGDWSPDSYENSLTSPTGKGQQLTYQDFVSLLQHAGHHSGGGLGGGAKSFFFNGSASPVSLSVGPSRQTSTKRKKATSGASSPINKNKTGGTPPGQGGDEGLDAQAVLSLDESQEESNSEQQPSPPALRGGRGGVVGFVTEDIATSDNDDESGDDDEYNEADQDEMSMDMLLLDDEEEESALRRRQAKSFFQQSGGANSVSSKASPLVSVNPSVYGSPQFGASLHSTTANSVSSEVDAKRKQSVFGGGGGGPNSLGTSFFGHNHHHHHGHHHGHSNSNNNTDQLTSKLLSLKETVGNYKLHTLNPLLTQKTSMEVIQDKKKIKGKDGKIIGLSAKDRLLERDKMNGAIYNKMFPRKVHGVPYSVNEVFEKADSEAKDSKRFDWSDGRRNPRTTVTFAATLSPSSNGKSPAKLSRVAQREHVNLSGDTTSLIAPAPATLLAESYSSQNEIDNKREAQRLKQRKLAAAANNSNNTGGSDPLDSTHTSNAGGGGRMSSSTTAEDLQNNFTTPQRKSQSTTSQQRRDSQQQHYSQLPPHLVMSKVMSQVPDRTPPRWKQPAQLPKVKNPCKNVKKTNLNTLAHSPSFSLPEVDRNMLKHDQQQRFENQQRENEYAMRRQNGGPFLLPSVQLAANEALGKILRRANSPELFGSVPRSRTVAGDGGGGGGGTMYPVSRSASPHLGYHPNAQHQFGGHQQHQLVMNDGGGESPMSYTSGGYGGSTSVTASRSPSPRVGRV